MNLAVPFATPRKAASAVQKQALAANNLKLTALPYNRLAPDITTWWLSPAPENPAYKFGKLVFTTELDVVPTRLFIGLNIEKGIGPKAAAPFADTAAGRRHIMDYTWVWHRFLKTLETGNFDLLVRRVEAQAKRSVMIMIDAGHISPPPQGPRSLLRARDVLSFHFSQGHLQLLKADYSAGLLQPAKTPWTLAALATLIQEVKEETLDWAWVDFYAGFLFYRPTVSSSDHEVWDADLIWQRTGLPWADWLY